MQPSSRRYFGPALKRLGRLYATASRPLQFAPAELFVSRGNGRAASPLACGAACN